MNLLFWGLTLSVLGKVLLAAGVVMAHLKIAHEHRIDRQVIHTFRVEFMMSVVGFILIILGYALEVYFFHGAQLLTCDQVVCMDTLQSLFRSQ